MRIAELSLLLLNICALSVRAGPAQLRLLSALFDNRPIDYVFDRPVANDSETVTVQIAFNLQQIINLDAKQQFLESVIWIEQYWFDAKMVWNPREYDGLSKIRLPVDKVWKPDILVYNSADEKFDGAWQVNVVVEHTGQISYIPPAMLKSTCRVKIRWFPFDEQCCVLKFGSWTYDETQLNLTLAPNNITTSGYIENGEFALLSVRAQRFDKTFEYGENERENYPYVALCFHMQRLGLYYTFNLFVPTLLVMAMSVLVFSLPADSGEKMGLSITILLSLTVFTTVISESLPRTSDATPLLGIYFTIIMFICSIAVIISVCVLNLHYYPDLRRDPPRWVRYGVCIRLASILRMRIPEELREISQPRTDDCVQKTTTLRCSDGKHDSNSNGNGNASKNCGGDESVAISHLETTQLATRAEQEWPAESPATNDSDLSLHSVALPGRELDHLDTFRQCCTLQLCMILKELRVLTQKTRCDSRVEDVALAWRFAATVVDRASLYVFLVVTLVCGCVVLFYRPTVFDDHSTGGPCMDMNSFSI